MSESLCRHTVSRKLIGEKSIFHLEGLDCALDPIGDMWVLIFLAREYFLGLYLFELSRSGLIFGLVDMVTCEVFGDCCYVSSYRLPTHKSLVELY